MVPGNIHLNDDIFLTENRQFQLQKKEEIKSKYINIEMGVSQGCIALPLFFLVYMNDIRDVSNSQQVTITSC